MGKIWQECIKSDPFRIMKRTYEIQNRITKEWAYPKAESFQEACESQGWYLADTFCKNLAIDMDEFIQQMKESVE